MDNTDDARYNTAAAAAASAAMGTTDRAPTTTADTRTRT